MKKKLLSIFLVLSLLLTSILCLLPASAEESENPADKAAREAGYVCRVGEAAENQYFKTVKDAVAAALANGKPVTLIADTELSDRITVNGGQDFVFDGNGKTLTVNAAFRLERGSITVKNAAIVTKDGMTSEVGTIVASGGTITFEDCTFRLTEGYARTDNGFFVTNTGSAAGYVLTRCEISVDKACTFANGANVQSLYARFNGNPTWKLDATTIDISENSKLNLVNNGYVTLEAANGSTIKTANSILAANVTISDSAATATAGNLFDYSGYGIAVNIRAANAALTAPKYVMNASGCKGFVSVTLDGSTVVNGTNRAFSITNNACPVTVTARGNTEIRSAGGDGNAIYVCGNDANASFTLTLAEQAKLISAKDVMSFAHGSNPITKAAVSILDHAAVQAENGYLLDAYDRPVVYNLSDKATIATKTGIRNGGQLTTNHIYMPTMLDGASVRIVEGSNGIRFTSTLMTEAKIVRYGTLIVKKADLGTTEFTAKALTAAGILFADIAATDAGTVAEKTVTTYNAALTNLPEDQFETDFAARAYAVYTINGEEYIVYSDFDGAANVRNISDVAEEARSDTKTARTDEYCHEVAEGTWSPYSKAQYEQLLTFIKKK